MVSFYNDTDISSKRQQSLRHCLWLFHRWLGRRHLQQNASTTLHTNLCSRCGFGSNLGCLLFCRIQHFVTFGFNRFSFICYIIVFLDFDWLSVGVSWFSYLSIAFPQFSDGFPSFSLLFHWFSDVSSILHWFSSLFIGSLDCCWFSIGFPSLPLVLHEFSLIFVPSLHWLKLFIGFLSFFLVYTVLETCWGYSISFCVVVATFWLKFEGIGICLTTAGGGLGAAPPPGWRSCIVFGACSIAGLIRCICNTLEHLRHLDWFLQHLVNAVSCN